MHDTDTGPEWDAIASLAPEFLAGYRRLAEVPRLRGALAPKDAELIQVAINASITLLSGGQLQHHIKAAFQKGATTGEVAEAVECASVLGIHGMTSGIRMVAELADEVPSLRERLSAPLDEEKTRMKEEFRAARGYWSDVWELVLRLTPDFFAAYAEFSSVPWRVGALEPKLKELIYVAIDASATHMYNPGTKLHLRNAFGYGATIEEVMEVLELTSLIGIQSSLLSFPMIVAASKQKI